MIHRVLGKVTTEIVRCIFFGSNQATKTILHLFKIQLFKIQTLQIYEPLNAKEAYYLVLTDASAAPDRLLFMYSTILYLIIPYESNMAFWKLISSGFRASKSGEVVYRQEPPHLQQYYYRLFRELVQR